MATLPDANAERAGDTRTHDVAPNNNHSRIRARNLQDSPKSTEDTKTGSTDLLLKVVALPR